MAKKCIKSTNIERKQIVCESPVLNGHSFLSLYCKLNKEIYAL